MGFDISYHPIDEKKMEEIYFNVMEDSTLIEHLHIRVPADQLKYESQREEFEAFYLDKYKGVIEHAQNMDEDDFLTSHAYIIAVAQGFFEEFFYTRGSALSFIEDDDFFEKYTTPWSEFTHPKYLKSYTGDRLDTNYSGGVYLSAEQVKKLIEDYKKDDAIKHLLDKLFSHKRIDVFMNALAYAKEKNLGILEASEVVEPSPIFGEEPDCYCNLFNCDTQGITLFQLTAQEQMESLLP